MLDVANLSAAIQGQVFDEKRNPVAGTRVVLHGAVRDKAADAPSPRTAITNHNGEYRADGLQPGRYYVSASAPDRSANNEVATFAGAGLLLGGTALVAGLVPSIRAAQIEVTSALRHE